MPYCASCAQLVYCVWQGLGALHVDPNATPTPQCLRRRPDVRLGWEGG